MPLTSERSSKNANNETKHSPECIAKIIGSSHYQFRNYFSCMRGLIIEMEESYAKIFRGIFNWEWYSDSKMVHLFLHLILKANHTDGTWKGIEIKRGQFIAGINKLNSETGISIQSLRTCMDKLKLTGEITIKSTNKYSIITICKYESYQDSKVKGNNQINKLTNNQSTIKATNKQQTTNKQLTTSKKENNNKNEKNDEEGKEETILMPPVAAVENKISAIGKEEAAVDISQFNIPLTAAENSTSSLAVRKKEKSTLYEDCLKIYADFFNKLKIGKPELLVEEKSAMKQIIERLKKTAVDKKNINEEVKETWAAVLSRYDNWTKYQKENIKINQILSNFSNLLNSTQNGNNTPKFIKSTAETRREIEELEQRTDLRLT